MMLKPQRRPPVARVQPHGVAASVLSLKNSPDTIFRGNARRLTEYLRLCHEQAIVTSNHPRSRFQQSALLRPSFRKMAGRKPLLGVRKVACIGNVWYYNASTSRKIVRVDCLLCSGSCSVLEVDAGAKRSALAQRFFPHLAHRW